MRRLILVAALAASPVFAQAPDFWTKLKDAIEHNLGKPYVWGSTGMKSYDCSGFVWRMLLEDGVMLKRTTARKLYMSLPSVKPGEEWQFGQIVFFDSMKHCGFVNSRRDFYHAQTSRGTNLSSFEPYWRGKVCGLRAVRRD
jgi:cell wall-associated NlpC family hydrolase